VGNVIAINFTRSLVATGRDTLFDEVAVGVDNSTGTGNDSFVFFVGINIFDVVRNLGFDGPCGLLFYLGELSSVSFGDSCASFDDNNTINF